MTLTPIANFALQPTRSHSLDRRHARLFVTLWLLLPALALSQVTPQEKTKEPLGSLSSVGEAYVNDSTAPAEITIFSGDRVRVGATGSATFSTSGKGLLKLSPGSQVLFSAKYEYTAELEVGAVVINSVSGPNGFTLRIGNDVVVASTKEHTSVASIDKVPDGSFLVNCSEGPLGVLNLLGGSGQFLESGQSVSVSPNGEMFSTEKQGPTAAKSTSGAQKHKSNAKVWGFLGLAAAAGAAGAAFGLSHGGGAKQTVTLAGP